MIYKRIALLLFTVLFILSGCQSPALYNQTENNAADAQINYKKAMAQSDLLGAKQPPLLINQGLYVDKTPINLRHEPTWLRSTIIVRGNDLPFSYYTHAILGNGHILTHYQTGTDQAAKLSINYAGSVKGALELLASRTGYAYSVNGNNLYWQAFVTKTFDVAFLPGTADYTLGDSSSGGGGASAGGSATGAVTGGITNGLGQNSSIKGTLSVWKDVEETIKSLLSSDGKVLVSQSTTTITVHDKPANVALISKYVENLNKNLSKQVLVKIQVIQLTLNSGFNYGINWDIVQRAFNNSLYTLNANYGTPISITPVLASSAPNQSNYPAGGLTNPSTTGGTGFTILVSALKQQGKTAIVSEPRVLCLNNQVSVVNIIQKTVYAASVSSTALAGGASTNGSSVTSSVTPGTIVAGLVLYILPKIMHNRIILDVNADLSELVSNNTFVSGSGGSSPASIQTPVTNESEFNQRAVIGSGDTMILSGYRQVQNQTAAVQFLDSQALGGKGAQEQNQEIVILITPILLNGYA